MTNVMKKISALLLTLALVFTMMPFLAAPVNADDAPVFSVCVNGSGDFGFSQEYLEETAIDAQVFPFAADKGKTWKYVVAKGPSYESILAEALGLESLEDISGTSLRWLNAEGAVQGNFDLYIDDLIAATEQFKLVDQNGNEISGGFNGDAFTSVKAVPLEGAKAVVPIVAYKEHVYDSYAEAVAALENGSWETGAGTDIRPYVGGNLSKDTFLKENGEIKMGGVNFTGKFSMVNQPKLNVKVTLPESIETSSIKMKVGDAGQALTTKYSDRMIDLFCYAVGENAFPSWTNEDPSVAEIDDSGKLVPFKAGTTKITMGIYADDAAEQYDVVLAEWTVTVEAKTPAVTPAPVVSKPAPAKPTGLKVKNVKKKTAKISWAQAVNAEGYEVFRSTKKKKGYKMVADVQTNNYKNKKLKKKKTYYYKVRSYNVVNGQKVYSSFSTAKKVKIKK